MHTHVHEVINGLRSIGWTVELFATSHGGASAGTNYVSRLSDYTRIQRALFRRLTEFDAIYCRAHFAALPLSLAAARKGKFVFQEVNGKPADIGVTYGWTKPFIDLIARSYRVQLKNATHIFVVTPGLKAWAETEAGHARVTLVPNAANTDLFKPEGPRAIASQPYVIFVGGLVAWHGIRTLLLAIECPDWPRGVRLHVIGDGVERAIVEAAARRGTITWLGRRTYREVPEHLRGAIAALCVIEDPDGRSAAGVAPLKLFEALACGVPVIVSDLPYQADLVRTHHLGVTIPQGDPHALARAVAALVSDLDEAKGMGRRGAEYVLKHASWQSRANDISKVMADVLDANEETVR